MYRNAQSRIRVNGTFTDDFLAHIGLHQELSPLLFIILLETLSREFRSGYPDKTILY